MALDDVRYGFRFWLAAGKLAGNPPEQLARRAALRPSILNKKHDGSCHDRYRREGMVDVCIPPPDSKQYLS